MNFSHAHERGFTLVETLVAITILMIALVGPYYAIQQSITTSNAARDQLIASALAQEGAEYIYFVRDNNYLSNSSWLNGMNACTGTYGCTVDPTQSTPLAACGSSGCAPLNLSATGLYTQANGNPATRFTRTVKLQSISAYQEQVTVTVTWITSHRNFTIRVTENVYNWL